MKLKNPSLHSPTLLTTRPSSTWTGQPLPHLIETIDALVKRSQTTDSCFLSTCFPPQHHMILSGTVDTKSAPGFLRVSRPAQPEPVDRLPEDRCAFMEPSNPHTESLYHCWRSRSPRSQCLKKMRRPGIVGSSEQQLLNSRQRMPETLDLRPTSMTKQQEDVTHQEDPVAMEPVVIKSSPPEVRPLQLLTVRCLDQALPTPADTQSCLDRAKDDPDARQVFLPTVVLLGTPEPISPLPEVDI